MSREPRETTQVMHRGITLARGRRSCAVTVRLIFRLTRSAMRQDIKSYDLHNVETGLREHTGDSSSVKTLAVYLRELADASRRVRP